MTRTMTKAPPPASKAVSVKTEPENLWSLSPFGLTWGRMLDDLWTRRWPDAEKGMISPAFEVVENDDAVLVTGELPGMNKKDINVKVEDRILTISGEKRSKTEEKKANYYCMERRYGSFSRSFTLPTNVKADAVKAELDDGVLQIRLPKTESAKARSITIN